MKATFIKNLNKEEAQYFRKSSLFEKISQNWATTDSFIEYNCEYFGTNYIDYSIVVFERDVFYIGMYCFSNDQNISFFGQPVTVYNIEYYSPKLLLAFQVFLQKISELKLEGGFTYLYCFTTPMVLSSFFNALLSSAIEVEAFVDLNQTEDLIRTNVRKSFKSLINWGITNLKMVIINKSNPNKEIFDSFKHFHVKVSGRQTRSDYSWELQFKAIKNERAYLILGYYMGELVSGAYNLYGSDVAYYGVAVNDRELMAKNLPIGHAVLFKSILYAKEIGLKKFILGTIEKTSDIKINDILKYKKGFTNTLESKIKHLIQL